MTSSTNTSMLYQQRASEGLELLGLSVAREHLDGVSQRAAAEGWSYTHFLGFLLDGELNERHRKRVVPMNGCAPMKGVGSAEAGIISMSIAVLGQ
jgi:hypothetical protein